MPDARGCHGTAVLLAFWSLLLAAPPAHGASTRVVLIAPLIDQHNRLDPILDRLRPPIAFQRVGLERVGGRDSTTFVRSFGEVGPVDLASARWVILANAPLSALQRMKDGSGRTLSEALPDWVQRGGRLLIVGGVPSFATYRDSRFASVLPFDPVPDPGSKAFLARKRRALRGESAFGLYVDHIHPVDDIRGVVRIWAEDQPFVVERRLGLGLVTTVLSGAPGQLFPDGKSDPDEWFESETWARFISEEADGSLDRAYTLAPPLQQGPSFPVPPAAGFDIRYWQIANQPYPFSLTALEAYQRARELASLGFTSTVVAANPQRPENDRQVMDAIVRAGLRVIDYDTLRRTSGRGRFPKAGPLPLRAKSIEGKDAGWDVHDERFREAFSDVLERRPWVRELPLSAVEVIEEFQDGDMRSPSLLPLMRKKGLTGRETPGVPGWIEYESLRADATAETFQSFRRTAQHYFPDVPQATYWPGSYWTRPNAYTFRPSGLADAVDELMAPGYGYQSGNRTIGWLSVVRSVAEAFAAFGNRLPPHHHIAVYAMGSPIRPDGPAPDFSTWRETDWTALSEGATGLAYYDLPHGDAIAPLGALHRELARLGPWLANLPRQPGPVAVLGSWTTRSEGNPDQTKRLAACYAAMEGMLTIGVGSSDVIFEDALDRRPGALGALVIVATPALSPTSATEIGDFMSSGGHVFIDSDSARRVEPGGHRPDLAANPAAKGHLHEIPARMGCNAARAAPTVVGAEWSKMLDSLGLRPEARTDDPQTAATVRGSAEIIDVYFLNHSASPRTIRVTTAFDANPYTWTDLRTGARQRPEDAHHLQTDRPIAPADATVWIGVKRTASKLQGSLSVSGDRLGVDLSGSDQAGAPLADGYPVRIEVLQGSDEIAAVSASLSGGHAKLQIRPVGGLPAPAHAEPLTGRLIDPVTGHTYPLAAARGSAGAS